jgi:hypothetical protein
MVIVLRVELDHMDRTSELQKIVSTSERLGVIGSPSSTAELSLDILGTAAMKKLVGELALFQFPQDERLHYALGQITGVALRNVWHEDPTMRSLIRQRGRVDAVSERQDTHLAQMTVSAVFSDAGNSRYEPSILGTVPSTGTNITIVSDEILEEMLRPYQNEVFFLGHVYGSKPRLPMWFKHFGSGTGGAGEAYHLGIFGKTGSGKSVLAKMMLCAYARHREMAILVIDPQGEFARDMRGHGAKGGISLPLRQVVSAQGRPEPQVHTVKSLILDRWDLFEEILFESEFFARLTMPRGDNRREACGVLADQLQKDKVKLVDLADQKAFDKAVSILSQDTVQQQFYRSASARSRFAAALLQSNKVDLYAAVWKPVAELFREDRPNAVKVESMLWRIFNDSATRPILVIDLSREDVTNILWNDHIQALVIKRLLDGLNFAAEQAYQEGSSLNALVVIDEAHRLAPRGSASGLGTAGSVRDTLVDAARTTRKYGLGWLFISQTLSSIDPEIIQQLRIMFFGFGLSMGQEYQSLREIAGSSSSALDLYRLFRDPHSSFDEKSRQYSFMTVGPVSPLSFAGTPLFFNAFNSVEEFLGANGLITRSSSASNSLSPSTSRVEPDRARREPMPTSRVTTYPASLPGFFEEGSGEGMPF